MKTVIFDISGVYAEECGACNLPLEQLCGGMVSVLDFRSLEGTNCYCDPGAEAAFRGAAQNIEPGTLRWIDTGDYHYLSKILSDCIREPFELLLYDNHPDSQPSAFGGLSCGNWVGESEKDNAFLRRITWVNGNGEVERRIPEGRKADEDCDCLPVYLSIDLDILSEEEFYTDWNQGQLPIPSLEADIFTRVFSSGRKLLGVDVCGGITKAKGASDAVLRHNFWCRRRFSEFLRSYIPLNSGAR